MARRVAIIGAGYAGLAAAVELASGGIAVDVFEASRTLGGRARSIDVQGMTLDNGAHILVGAYRETLRLMARVGAEPRRVLQRRPLRLEYPGELRIAAPPHRIPAPAPLHLAWALLTARGLAPAEKFAAMRFMRAIKAQGFTLAQDISAAELLAAHGQGARLRRYLWEPLCVAALNTEIERASAQVFLNVLRDSLAADRAASDLLLPATDFSQLFPEPAAAWLAAHGGSVQRGARIAAVRRHDGRYTVEAGGREYDNVIIAVAPYHLPRLIAGLPQLAALSDAVGGFVWEPIVTAYLAYAAGVRLPWPMIGVAAGCAQWLFDRGSLCGQPGLIAAVISAHGRHEDLGHAALAQRIHGEIAGVVPHLPAALWTRVIVEKRATFACTPGMARPATATALPGLYLAGDYVAGDYPATLEAAVRSGVRAARAILG
ncbi:MAG: hydroxysqualene dehydroxylase HpnE [Rhodocyclaceae bacterium]|nr:hydroxysqualene dehydroxylase HpnE [Rhodocyclaceae bacterium]